MGNRRYSSSTTTYDAYHPLDPPRNLLHPGGVAYRLRPDELEGVSVLLSYR